MNKKTTFLKLALITLVVGLSSKASAQSISAIGDFGVAAMTSVTQVICEGKSVDLSVPSAPDTEYKWLTRHKSTDGTALGASETLATNTGTLVDPATNVATAGYYIYRLEAKNTVTNCSEIFDQLVYVLPKPTITITAPADLQACINATENILLTASAAATPSVTQTFAVTYQWYSQKQGGGAETLITGATANTYTVATPATGATADLGSYDYYAKVKYVIKDCGETSSDKKTVDIIAAPTRPTITIASN